MSPDTRQHRGAHPEDRELFARTRLPSLREAVGELSWLLSHGYSSVSSLKLVGDRHSLTDRQRLAVSRAACSDGQLEHRASRCIPIGLCRNECLVVDGFNLIITVEAALGGGVLLLCRDGCIRDLSSVHGSYRSVEETDRAICLIGETLVPLTPKSVRWLLDRPVGNSGRLAQRINGIALSRDWPWSAQTVMSPDSEIAASDQVVVTSDSAILDIDVRWINLGYHLVEGQLSAAWLVDLRRESKSLRVQESGSLTVLESLITPSASIRRDWNASLP